MRYRTERRTGTYTDAEGNTQTYTYTVEVPYNYYILNVNADEQLHILVCIGAVYIMTEEQLCHVRCVYVPTSGNKPRSVPAQWHLRTLPRPADLSGVTYYDHTAPTPRTTTALVAIIAEVGSRQCRRCAYVWSWYGNLNSFALAWCAGLCVLVLRTIPAGLSEPRFAGCQSQGRCRGLHLSRDNGARGAMRISLPATPIFFN